MPLIQCPDCSREVSDQAPACPSCGRPIAVQRVELNSEPIRVAPTKGEGCFLQTLNIGCVVFVVLFALGCLFVFVGLATA